MKVNEKAQRTNPKASAAITRAARRGAVVAARQKIAMTNLSCRTDTARGEASIDSGHVARLSIEAIGTLLAEMPR